VLAKLVQPGLKALMVQRVQPGLQEQVQLVQPAPLDPLVLVLRVQQVLRVMEPQAPPAPRERPAWPGLKERQAPPAPKGGKVLKEKLALQVQ
jgi:hypothetical protein